MKQPLNPATHFAMLLMALAMSLAFLACEEKSKKADAGGGESNVQQEVPEATEVPKAEEANSHAKLLEKIINENGTIKFEYDDQIRIIKKLYYNNDGEHFNTETFTYNSDGSIKIRETNYSISGNTITTDITIDDRNDRTTNITINKDGYIVKEESAGETEGDSWGEIKTYQYQNGNLYKYHREATFSYDVDSFTVEYKYDNKKSPFYYCKSPKWFLQLLPEGDLGFNNNIVKQDEITYAYEYDSDEFPTKVTIKGRYTDGKVDITTFTYLTL
jgi:hypothetical protein